MAANSYQPINLSTYQPIRFGTDGWRGIIAEDFTFENVKIVAQAFSDYLHQTSDFGHRTSVVIGYDTRFLSDKFAEIFARVLLANGIKTKLTASIVSTPLLSFTVKNYGFDWGVMFSASHNPGKYNGIKFRASYGGPVSVEVTRQIENYLARERVEHRAQTYFDDKATVEKAHPLKDYFAYLRSRIDFNTLKRLKAKIVVDPLYGCAQGYLEEILKDTKISVIAIHNYPDPLFGGLQPEQVEHNLGELKKKVKEERAFLGFAFDGDADRLAVVDEKGRYLTPHYIFPLLLYYLVKERGLKGKVVQTVSLGYLSKRIAQKYGLLFEEVPVGFKYVSQRMLEENVLIGGEESGGYGFGKLTTLNQSKGGFTPLLCPKKSSSSEISFGNLVSTSNKGAGLKGWLPERDGILSALLFLEMLASLKKKTSQLTQSLTKEFGHSYFLRKDYTLSMPINKGEFVNKILPLIPEKILNTKVKEVYTFDGIKIIFSDDSWLLLRPSGTEPLFRSYAETDSLEKTKKLLVFGKKLVYNLSAGSR